MAIPFEKAAAIVESSFAPYICRCVRQDEQVTVHIYPPQEHTPAHSVQVPLSRLASVRSTAQLVLEIRQSLSASPTLSLHSVISSRSE